MTKKFYITTPIYYPSGNLHIGHAYTTTLADVLVRFKKLMGFETYFLTGSDEHGQKIEAKAKEQNTTPIEYVDKIILNFKELWAKLNVDYDIFFRTTNPLHVRSVQKIFNQLLEKGYIYKGVYSGLYCINCEEFLTADQIDENGLCKISLTKPEFVQEDSYFLKTSAFVNYLKELFATDFLIPETRRKEMLNNFILPGLEDLSVTRTSFKWGIPLPNDPDHIVYVWLDALTNYVTALDWIDNGVLFQKFWADPTTEIVQLVGKEITRFHSIYWPIILKCLDLRIPNKLISHGWILSNETKMSKSIGNIINPLEYIAEFGADSLRFYLAYELPIDRDGNFTRALFIESFNTNLANNIGNLISRTSNMIIKYFDGELKHYSLAEQEIFKLTNETKQNYINLMNEYKIDKAIELVLKLGQVCNKAIEEVKPWVLFANNELVKLKDFLAVLRYANIWISVMLSPILPKKSEEMLDQFGVNNYQIKLDDEFQKEPTYNKIIAKKIIFNRIEFK